MKNDALNQKFGLRLKLDSLRQSKGISAHQVSLRAGVSANTALTYMSDKQRSSVELRTLIALLMGLGYSMSEIMAMTLGDLVECEETPAT